MAGNRNRKVTSFCALRDDALPRPRVSHGAAGVIEHLKLDMDLVAGLVAQHYHQCPRRWRNGQQLETPLMDGRTDRPMLWVATLCNRARLFTVVFAPGEDPAF